MEQQGRTRAHSVYSNMEDGKATGQLGEEASWGSEI